MELSSQSIVLSRMCLFSCLAMVISGPVHDARVKRQMMFPAERSLGLQNGAFSSPLGVGPVQYPAQLYGNPGRSNYNTGYPGGGAPGQLIPNSFAASSFQPALLPQQQSQYLGQPQQPSYIQQQPQQNFQQSYLPAQQTAPFQQRGLPVQQPLMIQQNSQNNPVQNDQPQPNFGANGGFTSGFPSNAPVQQNGGYQPQPVQEQSSPFQFRSIQIPNGPSPSAAYPSNFFGNAQQVPSYANSVNGIQTQPQVQDERPALTHAYQEVIANQMHGQPFVSATEAPSLYMSQPPQSVPSTGYTVSVTTGTPFITANRDTKMVSNDATSVNTIQQPVYPVNTPYQPEHDILPYPQSDQFRVPSTPIPQTPSEVESQKAGGVLPSSVTVGTTIAPTAQSTTQPTTQQTTLLTTVPFTTSTGLTTQPIATTQQLTSSLTSKATTTSPFFDLWFSKTESPEVVGRTKLLGVMKMPNVMSSTSVPTNQIVKVTVANGSKTTPTSTTSSFSDDDLKGLLPPPKNETIVLTKRS